MTDLIKRSGRLLLTVWFWAFVLLTLPNCGLPTEPGPDDGFDGGECGDHPCACDDPDSVECLCDGDPECSKCDVLPDDPDCVITPDLVFDPGISPTNAIMCDIPAPLAAGDDGCAVQADIDSGLNFPLTQAAVLLAIHQSTAVALDYSAAATGACGGFPKKIRFLGGYFPDGATVCINCSTQIGTVPPAKYATPTDACIAKCKDLVPANLIIPAEGTDAYCEANAHTSTNYDKNICYNGACIGVESPDFNFVDPRRTPEPVVWIEGTGTDDNGGTNSLTRNAATSVPPDFDAGAASAQTILSGDGWVDFSALENNLSHVLGVRPSCEDPADCPDTVLGLDDIGFAISLNSDGQVYLLESGPPLTVSAALGPYNPGDRFRVKFVDNHDGTATISYAKVVGTCNDGTACTEEAVGTPSTVKPAYPLRVDATFREQNATLSDVRLVRIIPQQ